MNAERGALVAFLDGQRASAVAVLAGLDDDALRRTVVPSGWTPLGLLAHLGDAEQFWARRTAGDVRWNARPDDRAGSTEVLGYYHDQCALTDSVIAATGLDDPPRHPVADTVDHVHTVRDVVLHLVEETARHAGHLDIARELIDGRTGLGPR